MPNNSLVQIKILWEVVLNAALSYLKTKNEAARNLLEKLFEENKVLNERNETVTQRCNDLTTEVLHQRKTISKLNAEKSRLETL